jgi:hypothetical protein
MAAERMRLEDIGGGTFAEFVGDTIVLYFWPEYPDGDPDSMVTVDPEQTFRLINFLERSMQPTGSLLRLVTRAIHWRWEEDSAVG